MDNERMQLATTIKEKLHQRGHTILDLYIDERGYSIDYYIVTNKNTIVLSIKIFFDSVNRFFDVIYIYDYDCNHLLLEVPLTKNHTFTNIYEIVADYFTPSQKN